METKAAPSLPPGHRLAMFVGRIASPAYPLLGALWIFLAVGLPARGLSLVSKEFVILTAFAVVVCLVARLAHISNFPRVALALRTWTVFWLACMTFILVNILLATGHAPFADATLAAADRLLFPGVDWTTVAFAITAKTSLLMPAANFAYDSITWQPVLLFALYAAMGLERESNTFVFAWMVTLALVMAVFAFTPALGAYAHFGISAQDVPSVHATVAWRQPQLLTELRSGTLTVIGLHSFAGLVTFPSFHAAAAVLLASGFWVCRWTRWPFLILNTGMLMSAIPVGGHYYIDLPAGIAVAALGLGIARHCYRDKSREAATGRTAIHV